VRIGPWTGSTTASTFAAFDPDLIWPVTGTGFA
jgi:hypothetical protein